MNRQASGNYSDQPNVKKIKVDLSDEIYKYAVKMSQQALDSQKSNQDRAHAVRMAMDNQYGPAWGAIVGQDFGRWISVLIIQVHLVEIAWCDEDDTTYSVTHQRFFSICLYCCLVWYALWRAFVYVYNFFNTIYFQRIRLIFAKLQIK